MSKGKLFKNTLRSQKEEVSSYVPQYVIHGVKPETFAPGFTPEVITPVKKINNDTHILISSQHNPRRGSMQNINPNVPFANISSGPSPIGRGPLPNIGNNLDNSWSSVDAQVFDDISDEPVQILASEKIIDNNDFHNYGDEQYVDQSEDDIKDNLITKDYDYVLLVMGEVISTGFLEEIQEEVKSLIFGEHPLCEDNVITQNDITVLKKVNIKVGVFID